MCKFFVVLQFANDGENKSEVNDTKQAMYVTFSVKIHLLQGHNLVIRDASGSSDPYVKFKYKGRTYYKSSIIFKNLNPIWKEEFTFLVDDITVPICLDVYDYDRWASDDYMGGAIIDLSQLKFFQRLALKLKLYEEGNNEDMGEIDIVVSIFPLNENGKEEFLKKSTRGIICERQKKTPQKITQIWSSIVNIVLIEGRNLASPNASKYTFPDLFVKFKLGSEKYKSKSVLRNNNPKWLEQFDLHMFDDSKHLLEMMVIDKKTNTSIGRYSIDLDKLEKETSHQMACELDHSVGTILLLISITGTASTHAVTDLSEYSNINIRSANIKKYSLWKTHESLTDVGFLTVKVFRARNLASIDVINKSNPYVVVELVNALLQTHTEYKTINPEWNKLFTFAVKDIHSTLEITVYDEDPNKKAEFLGKVAIPLLKIRNCESKWYTLKDRKLQAPAKGQVLLEMDIIWNPIRAALRTFNPRERKYMQEEPKFKRRLFINNFTRLREFLLTVAQIRDYIQSCFDWDSPMRSLLAFMLFVTFINYFQIYHIPLLILLIFFLQPFTMQRGKQKLSRKNSNIKLASGSEDEYETIDMVEIALKKISINSMTNNCFFITIMPTFYSPHIGQLVNKSSSIRQRFNTLQDAMVEVQNTADFIASLLERIRNTFNFTQPYLSVLAIVVLSIATILLYLVPLRWLVMIWGE
ncbi:unnamed protein product [Thelazia callipaeda]|uniref:Multiple C2 and transmembrane domain-containing protein 1-like n=1 Tax=Thelazia callipaeda TaxID=103827 RepID=A0A0N5D1Q4_THECL|nr:unnamed protein product [Thelazia callipaeda]